MMKQKIPLPLRMSQPIDICMVLSRLQSTETSVAALGFSLHRAGPWVGGVETQGSPQILSHLPTFLPSADGTCFQTLLHKRPTSLGCKDRMCDSAYVWHVEDIPSGSLCS